MKKQKKVLWVNVVLVMMLFLLVSCSPAKTDDAGKTGETSGTQKEPEKTAAAPTGEATQLVIGLWDKNQEPMVQALAAKYQESHPNVTITTQLTPYKGREYWTKLEASTVGGTAPDVFWMNALNVEKFMEAGMLADLTTDLDAAGITGQNFPQSLLDLYTFDGKIYGVPKDFDTNALWYNKELFDAAGVAYPNDNWTWEDMVEAAKKLTDKSKNIYGIAAPLDFQTCYYNTVFGAGGYILNADKTKTGYDDPKTIEGIDIWVQLIKDGVSPSLADMTDTSADAMFESGRIAMLWAGSYMTPEYTQNEVIKDKIDLVEAPAYKQKANVINGLSYAVYEKSANKAAAIELAIWLGSTEAMKIQGESGVVISARNDAQKYFAESNPNINLKAYTNQAQLATVLPACYVSGELFTAEDKWLKQAFAGEISTEEACKALAEEANKILENR